MLPKVSKSTLKTFIKELHSSNHDKLAEDFWETFSKENKVLLDFCIEKVNKLPNNYKDTFLEGVFTAVSLLKKQEGLNEAALRLSNR